MIIACLRSYGKMLKACNSLALSALSEIMGNETLKEQGGPPSSLLPDQLSKCITLTGETFVKNLSAQFAFEQFFGNVFC